MDSITHTRKVYMGKELITEITSASITSSNVPPYTTDQVVSQYENRINQTIASKILSSSKSGTPPIFTKEENAYITKKAAEDDALSEVKVITPDPTITLKKGKTEINIKNAATLVKKMEEIYPSVNQSLDQDVDIVEDTKHKWKQASVYNDKGVLEDVISNPHYIPKNNQTSVSYNKDKHTLNTPTGEMTPEYVESLSEHLKKLPHGDPRPLNKNAYEIRADVLSMAIEWLKWQTQTNIDVLNRTTDHQTVDLKTLPTSDYVLEIAQKFYRFVENRK